MTTVGRIGPAPASEQAPLLRADGCVLVRTIAELERDWDELADRLGASPFQRPGWVAAWWDAFGTGKPEILSVRRQGHLAAVLPLCRVSGLTQAMSNEHTPVFGALAEDGAARHELYRTMLARAARRISLTNLDPTDPGTDTLRSIAAAAGWSSFTMVRQRSPYTRIAGEPSPKKVASEIRRRRRRLEELGRLSFEFHAGLETSRELLEEGFAIEGSGWKDARGTAVRSRPSTLRHYTAVATWAARRGLLRLAFLRLDGRPIAFQFALQDERRYYFLKGGYATEYARYGPGKLLVEETLDVARAAALESYEFLGAAEPWKLGWADALRERVAFEAFAPSPIGRIDHVVHSLLQNGRALAKRVLVGVR